MAPFVKCTKVKCNSTFHTPATSWMLHPELRQELPKASPVKKAFVAHVDKTEKPNEPTKEELNVQVELLKAQLAAKEEEVLRKRKYNIQYKPKIFDSGNNYSVISSIQHIDPHTNITLYHSEDTLATAGGNNLDVLGAGTMENLPAVYVPDATASMTSVHQFCEERNAVALFLKEGADGIKLNMEIIKYLSKIKEIAKEQGLELIDSKINEDKLYEITTNPSNYN